MKEYYVVGDNYARTHHYERIVGMYVHAESSPDEPMPQVRVLKHSSRSSLRTK